MFCCYIFQCIGSEYIVLQIQVLQRDFRPGRFLVPAGRADIAKDLCCQLACIPLIPVTPEYNHQPFTMYARDKNPGYIMHLVEKISYNNKDIRAPHSSNMGIEPPLDRKSVV